MSGKQDYIAKLEKAISQKYGDETIDNPKRFWDENKEKEYLQQSVEEQQKFAKNAESQDKIEADGFLINKKLLEACFRCYIQYIDGGREERWKSGWRPNKEQ